MARYEAGLQAELMPYHRASVFADRLFHARADRARGLRICAMQRLADVRLREGRRARRAGRHGGGARDHERDGDGPSGRADARFRFACACCACGSRRRRSRNAAATAGTGARRTLFQRAAAALPATPVEDTASARLSSYPGRELGASGSATRAQVPALRGAAVGAGAAAGADAAGCFAALAFALDQHVAQRLARDEARLDAPQAGR